MVRFTVQIRILVINEVIQESKQQLVKLLWFYLLIKVSYRQNKLLCTLPRLSVYSEYYSKTIRLFVLFSLTQVHKYYIIKKYKYTTVKKKKNLCNYVHCTLLTVHQSSVCPTVCLLISLSIWECPVSGHHSCGGTYCGL